MHYLIINGCIFFFYNENCTILFVDPRLFTYKKHSKQKREGDENNHHKRLHRSAGDVTCCCYDHNHDNNKGNSLPEIGKEKERQNRHNGMYGKG